MLAIICSSWIFVLYINTVNSGTFSDVTSLYDDLTTSHNPHLRPETNQNLATTIYTSFTLISLLDIDAVEGTVSITGYFTMTWTDRNLIWTPSNYGLIAKVTFPSDTIWRPPLIIGNSATSFKMIGMKDSYIKVVRTGLVLWQPGESIIFTCSIDSTYFPFDTQVCTCSLLVWGFDIDEVELHKSQTTIDTDVYQGNSEWDLFKTKIAEADEGINFEFHFKRRPMFLVISIILPVMFISLLNIFVFILPQESGERVGLAITSLLSIVVFLTIAQELLPATALPRLSAICVTLTIDMFMSGCIIISVIISSWLYHRSTDKTIPLWIQKVVLCRLPCRKTKRSKSITVSEVMATNKVKPQDVENDLDHKDHDPDQLSWQQVSSFWDKLSTMFYIVWFVSSLLVFVIDVYIGTSST